ncbi:MAG: hypothetical protein HY560_03770, partial [Gemmatimonadetes bacterium]|nr:hypothetical protein [Gemmatimonadota bacterium]
MPLTLNPIPVADQWSAPRLHVPFLEQASDGKEELRSHALGAFLTLRMIDRVAEADAKELSGTALAYQINACLNYLKELHPQTKEVSHLLEIVKVAKRVNTNRRRHLLWSPLLAFAYWLEQELRLDEALDVIHTALQLSDGHASEVAAYLQKGRVLRQASRFDESVAAYAEADRFAEARGDYRSQMVSRIGRAVVRQKTGALRAAEGDLRSVLAEAKRSGDRYVEARATHDLAATVYLMDRPLEAIPLAFRAHEL